MQAAALSKRGLGSGGSRGHLHPNEKCLQRQSQMTLSARSGRAGVPHTGANARLETVGGEHSMLGVKR